MTLSGVFVY